MGLVLGWLGNIRLLIPLVAFAYAFCFGVLEALGVPFRVPGLAWQVPSGWVGRRPAGVQTLTWGTTLGPGLVTRNPYAGMWLLLLLLALNSNPLAAMVVGVAIGAVHGGARALGVLNNRKYMDMDASYVHLRILGAQLRWQYFDGLALLLAAGALMAYVLAVLGVLL